MSAVINDDIRTREIELVPCSICGRTFQPRSLEKHYIACERSTTIKRPVFDSMQKRLAGTELARYNSYILSPTLLRKKTNNSNNTHSSTNSLNSNHEHRTVRNTTVSRPLGRNERCPYCERQFGPRAYDDHVKWCKEHSILNKNHKKVDNSLLEAKERLDARVRYRVPPVQKSKRTLIREKYSTPSPCPLKRTESVHDLTIDRVESNNNLLKRTASLRKPTNFCYSPKTPSTPLDFCDTSHFFSSTFSSNSSVMRIGIQKNFYDRTLCRDNIQSRSLLDLEKMYLYNLYMLSVTKNSKNSTSDNYISDLSDGTSSSSRNYEKNDELKKRKKSKSKRYQRIEKSLLQSSMLLKPQIRERSFVNNFKNDSFEIEQNDSSINEPENSSEYNSFKELSINNTSTPSKKNQTFTIDDDFIFCIKKCHFFQMLNNNSSEYDYNPFKSAERQLMELLQCDDFKIFSEDEHNTKTDSHFLNQHNTTNNSTSITSKIPSVKKSLPKIANFFRKSSSPNKSNDKNENLIMTLKPFTSKDDSIDYIDNNQSDSETLYQSDKNNNVNDNKIISKGNEEEINEIDLIFINKNDSLTTLPQNTTLYLNSYSDTAQINPNSQYNYRTTTSTTDKTTTVSSNNYLNTFLNDDCRDQSVLNNRGDSESDIIRNSGLYELNNQQNTNNYNPTITPQTPQKRQPKFCHECGTKYPIETAKFCVECGIKRLLF